MSATVTPLSAIPQTAAPVSATPVASHVATTAAPKETGLQKFESVFTGIGKFIQGVENAAINIGVAEEPTIAKYLPAPLATAVNDAVSLAASTWAAMEYTEQTIGASSLSYGQKVAAIVALQGANIAKVLVAGGAAGSASNIQQIVTLATGAAAINFGSITAAPVAPASSTTGA